MALQQRGNQIEKIANE